MVSDSAVTPSGDDDDRRGTATVVRNIRSSSDCGSAVYLQQNCGAPTILLLSVPAISSSVTAALIKTLHSIQPPFPCHSFNYGLLRLLLRFLLFAILPLPLSMLEVPVQSNCFSAAGWISALRFLQLLHRLGLTWVGWIDSVDGRSI